MSWNHLTPSRYPRLVVQVATEDDVIEAVHFARAHKVRIAVRGSGHSWVGFSLRDDSLLIDLGNLKQFSVDPEARRAVVQPAVTGRELNRKLVTHGLAFPVGHCPSVSLSGYLLNGGLGWNSNNWGPACLSIEAARVVTAAGSLVEVNQEQHPDLLWAIRGGGPGFFGVVTQYLLKLYPAPHAIVTSSYYYPLQRVEEVGAWAASIAGQLPKEVELTLFIAPAPPDLARRSSTKNGFVGILSATAFLDSEEDAVETLSLLEACPFINLCLKKEVNQPTPFDALLDLGGLLWPERHRCRADTLWSNSPAGHMLAKLCELFLRAPSAKSLAVCVFSTGGGTGVTLPDAAFSMWARTLLLCYAIWEQPEDDSANTAWHREAIAALDQFAVGHYVGESDIVALPERAERSYLPANWQRLQLLRQTYDPDDLFHGHFRAV